MRFLLFTCLLALTSCASSKDVVIQRGDLTVTLSDKACTSALVKELATAVGMPDKYKDNMKAGHAKAPDGDVDLCYLESTEPGSTSILIIDELGNMGAFDKAKK